MADGHLTDPLIAEVEGLDYPVFDETLLKELKQLDDAESGWAGEAAEHVEDEDVIRMRQLIREKPRDVIQYLEEEGVVKLGEFEAQDAVVFKALGKDSIMTMGADHYEVDWEAMWRDKLSEYSRSTAGMGWTTKILVEAHVVNLRDAAAEGSKGLLHPLLKRWHAGGTSSAVFGLPAVQAVIHLKWNSWARRFLLYELGCYCAWLAFYTVFTLLFQQEDWTMTLWETMADRNGFLATVFSLITLLPMAPFLYMELCTIAAYGWGWVGAWNVLDIISYFLQIVICVLHLQRDFMDEGWFSVLVATQHVLMWTKLHYFAKVFNPTKNTIVDTLRIVLDDMKWFLFFLTLTMLGFGLAFYALFRQDRDRFADFTNIWHSFASMFSYMLAMFDYNVFYNSTNPTAAMLLFIIFEFVMNVLLLNVLIASMTSSFSKITQDEGLRFLCSKAEIIDELETTLPNWVKSKAWYPPFIHILKIHPDSTYEVSLNSVWSGIGLMENNLLGAQQETRLRVEELEDRLAKLHKKLDVLIKLFISSMSPGQAAGLSRQATAGISGASAGSGGLSGYHGVGNPFKQASAAPFTPCGATFAHSSTQPHDVAAATAVPGSTQGHYLRHAATIHSHSPEQLAAVSGPLSAGHYAGQCFSGHVTAGYHPMWVVGPNYPAVYPPGHPAMGTGGVRVGLRGFGSPTSPPDTSVTMAASAFAAAGTAAVQGSQHTADHLLQNESLAPVAEDMTEAAAGPSQDTASHIRDFNGNCPQLLSGKSSAADGGSCSRKSTVGHRYSTADASTGTGHPLHNTGGGGPLYSPPSLQEGPGVQLGTQQHTDQVLPGHVIHNPALSNARLILHRRIMQRVHRRSLTRSCSF